MIDVEPVIVSELERMLPLPDGGRADWSDVQCRAGAGTRYGRSRVVRRRWPVVAIAAAAVLAAILVATPAWALVRDVLPFWDQPSAPSAVKVEFSHMNRGTPAGMSPQAVSGDTREIVQATIGGKTKTLWVAPSTGRFDFCWLWDPNFGGSCGSTAQPLGVLWVASKDDPETTQLVTGDAISPTVSDVVIRFSDGSSVHPHIVWVSAPINAGFFVYDVPADQQSSKVHATVIDAYDQSGSLVSKQGLSGG